MLNKEVEKHHDKEKRKYFWEIFRWVSKLKEFGFKNMPVMDCDHYVYRDSGFRTEYQYSIGIGDEANVEDLYIYGYIIESRRTDWPSHVSREFREMWQNHWNHKIFKNKELAMDSINQFKIGYCSNYEFRILPMYSFKNSSYRTYLINKIIKEE